MGIDWEDILDTEVEYLADAYEADEYEADLYGHQINQLKNMKPTKQIQLKLRVISM